MPNKIITRTQTPVKPENLFLELSPVVNDQGVYQKHQLRAVYTVYDDQGVQIDPKRDFHRVSLSPSQETALANFVATLVSRANALENT